MLKTGAFALTLLASVSTIHHVSYAQNVENVGDASVVTYEKDYFSKYNAVTLLDMLQIIPGAKEILDKNKKKRGGGDGGGPQSDRGFGSSGDQILINGKRLAGKTNNVDDTLGRISADQIEKVELIRGAASGLDVQSQGLIINVILAAGASTSTTFWKLSNRYTIHNENQPGFLVSHSGAKNSLDYSFSVERNIGGMIGSRIEEIFDADDVKTADHYVHDGFEFSSIDLVTNLAYNFKDGAVLRLNGLYAPGNWTGEDRRDKTSDAIRPQIWPGYGDSLNWEIGGDYTKNLAFLGSFKALFLLNGDSLDENLNRFKGTGDEKFEYSIEKSPQKSNERIFRASFTNNIFNKHTLELGGEAAINTVHREFVSEERDSVDDGFELISSDIVDIKENRYEIFANHTYDVSSKIVLQSSLTTEFSKIVADNIFADGIPTKRDTRFTYIKPRINLRYDLSKRDQIRATVEKKVSQLNFNNFVSYYDRNADVVRAGNTEIRPEQIWEFSAQYEHRFPNDGGSFDVEVFYHKYKDHIGKVDFTEYKNFSGEQISANAFYSLPPTLALRNDIINGSDFISKSGNIPEAYAYGLKANTSVRLGFMGLKDALVGFSYTYEKTETTNQFTGKKSVFDWRSPHKFAFNFRHDLTKYGFSYGFNGEAQSNRESNDIRYHWTSDPEMEFNAFAEYILFDGIKMRLDAENINTKKWDAVFNTYVDHIRFDEYDGRTTKYEKRTTEITFSIQGTF